MVALYVYVLVAISSFLVPILIVGLVNLIKNRSKRKKEQNGFQTQDNLEFKVE